MSLLLDILVIFISGNLEISYVIADKDIFNF